MPDDLKNILPFNIKLERQREDVCSVTLELSWEMAEQLIEMAAPFMQQLAQKVEKRTEQNLSRTRELQSLQDETRRANLLALRALRIVRKKGVRIEQVANRLGMEYNVAAEIIINRANIFKRERVKRFYRFRDRYIAQEFAKGRKKLEIAKATSTTIHIVNKAIAIHPMKMLEHKPCRN